MVWVSLAQHLLKAIKNKNINIFNIDKKTYASFDHNKKLIKISSYKFYKIDISNYLKIKKYNK